MVSTIEFDTDLGAHFIRYAHMVARRGYVHNTLGNMVMRKPHPDFEHGVAYTKHAEISLSFLHHGRDAHQSEVLASSTSTKLYGASSSNHEAVTKTTD